MIVNLQRKVKLDAAAFREFVDRALASIDEAAGGSVSIAFVSDCRMRELNKFFRDKDATTDVLSFPHEPEDFEVLSPGFSRPDGEDQPPEGGTQNFLGDIVISTEQAVRQAKENKLTLDAEIRQLILHGLLHLCGYDHETDDGEMNARELELRDQLDI